MRLNQITAPARDISESVSFYKRLGFRQIVESPHYARFEAPDGDTTFSLHLQDELPKGQGVVIYLEDDDIDAKVSALKASGVVFASDPKDESWLWREARLHDPSGNEICIYHAGENRLNPPWRIDADAGA